MNKPTTETLTRRLDRVGRENRCLKGAGLAALAVIAGVVVMGQATGNKVAKVVEAESFVVRDESGKTRAQLGVMADGATLRLYDVDGKAFAELVGKSYGAGALQLRDRHGIVRAIMFVGATEEPYLRLYDLEGKPRIDLAVEAGVRPVIAVRNKAGKVMWSAP